MSYLKNILPVWTLLALLFAVSTQGAFAFSVGPPDEKTGAPNEKTCAQTGCHAGNAINSSGGSLMLTVPETYIPNEVYTIVVNLSRAGQSRWGFEMTALDADGARAGSFAADAAGNTQLSEAKSKQYIKHTTAGTAQGTNDDHSWKFQWTAPDADIGPITFYTAGNASNGNFNPIDDYIYATQAESTPPIPVVVGVSLDIVGDAARATTDALGGVNYTLKVTNTGNMMDTLTLEASAEVGIEGSVLGVLGDRSVELEAGAAREITLKVAGDFFTKPGDYPIRVTATSKTDSTKTAAVTTTTTIAAPPPAPEVPKTPEVPLTIATPEVPPTPPDAEEPPAPEVPLTIVTPAVPSTPWDVNDDGIVNIQDLVLVAGEFGQSGEALKGDINGDGTVNVLDLVLVSSHFGETTNADQ